MKAHNLLLALAIGALLLWMWDEGNTQASGDEAVCPECHESCAVAVDSPLSGLPGGGAAAGGRPGGCGKRGDAGE